jgi:SAM-dependent methyltransferase
MNREQLIWDLQYFFGRWRHIDGIPDPSVSAAINEHLHGGAILDLGCGTGNIVRILGPYARYRGVDISRVAIHKARRRYAGAKNEFVVADLADYEPGERFDVILLSEVIYYVDLENVVALLERYRRSLEPGGVFVMRLWHKETQKAFIDVVAEHFGVLETRSVAKRPMSVVITFR